MTLQEFGSWRTNGVVSGAEPEVAHAAAKSVPNAATNEAWA